MFFLKLCCCIFQACLDDFSHHNIDVACNLLETCGRFLYRSPETTIRMANMLEILMRLKNVKNLDPRHSTLVENAYYLCKPPERSARIAKVRPPLHQVSAIFWYTCIYWYIISLHRTVVDIFSCKLCSISGNCFSRIWTNLPLSMFWDSWENYLGVNVSHISWSVLWRFTRENSGRFTWLHHLLLGWVVIMMILQLLLWMRFVLLSEPFMPSMHLIACHLNARSGKM